MVIKKPLPPFDAAQLGSVISCRPDLGSRIMMGFDLQVVGTGSPTFADYVEYVEILQNNKRKCLLKPAIQAKLDAIMNSNGDTFDTTIMRVPLARPRSLGFAWGTKDISEFAIQCKLVAANPSGKTLTRVQGWTGYAPIINPIDRGNVVLQTVVPSGTPTAGWNTLQQGNLTVPDIISLKHVLLNHDAVREVRIHIGDTEIYHQPRDIQFEQLVRSEFYKLPASYDAFPVVLDDLGDDRDYPPLIDANGVRRPIMVEYYWDTNVAAVAAFDILVEGVERGAPSAVANAKA